MTEDFKSKLLTSSKITTSDEWDALYNGFPVVIALSTDELEDSFSRLNDASVFLLNPVITIFF